ncbi:MAG: TraR/DksA C4-type zinc finger protein [Acidobacteria bacterium]|nr:TraR/DksA C4-type zinc finger protein [Acidobacteriota bacterium]
MAINTGKYRRLLLDERDKLKQVILGRTELPASFNSDGALDSADSSVREHSMDLEGSLMSMKSDRLEQINAALQRIERGVYGICAKCGKEIDPRRLDAEPAAMTCMDCLSVKEQSFSAPKM